MKNGAPDAPRHPAFSTFAEALQTHAARRPEALAFVYLNGQGAVEEQITYAALDRQARAVAAELVTRGFSGERILLTYPPGLAFVSALFGCFYAGSVAVPVPLLTVRRMMERVVAVARDAGAACLLKSNTHDDDTWLGGDVGVWLQSTIFPDAPPSFTPQKVASDQLAILQYTSGSTAAPKGVMITHKNLIANSEMIKAAFGHDETLRVVSWLPSFHDMGLVGHILQPVYVGGLSVLMAPSSFLKRPVRWLEAISEWRATSSGGPSHAFDLCARMVRPDQMKGLDLSAWTVAYCGSEKVDHGALARFAAAFRDCGFSESALYPCYGLAEATLLATGGRKGSGVCARDVAEPARGATSAAGASSAKRIVSCGHPWGDSRIAIVEPETRRIRDEGEVGEIWISGPHVGAGYFGRPEESAQTFHARIAGSDDGPWLRTGDLGFSSDADLYVVGRIKEIIVIRGQNHSPEDIEATVRESHPACAGQLNAAFSVEVKGEERVVVVQELPSRLDGAGLEAIRAATLAAVTHDHGLRVEDLVFVLPRSIPRTSSGKVQRGRCRVLHEEGRLGRLTNPAGAGPQHQNEMAGDVRVD